ncbi:MAG: methionyl-tRNA formyltransferase, partial [bacterium]
MAKIIFMGTPDFAVPALEQLIKAGHEIPLVICQPDKKKGRGQKFQFPPVKEYALEQKIEVFQPRSV